MRTEQIFHLLSMIHDRAGECIRTELDRRGPAGLVPSHGSILAMLYAQGPLPMNALAQGIGRRKNTVTTLVRKLEDAGFVQRSTDPADSRVTMVTLTDRGEAFRADFAETSERLLAKIWGDMDLARRQELVAGLEEILGNVS